LSSSQNPKSNIDKGTANESITRRRGNSLPARNSKQTFEAISPRLLLKSLRACRKGDFSVRLPEDLTGVEGEIAEAFNDVVASNQRMADELKRIAKVVGVQGNFKERASIGPAAGAWAHSIDALNRLIDDLVRPIAEVGRVTSAVAQGDLTRTIDLDPQGRRRKGAFLHTAKAVNAMVERLALFAAEVTRVACELGTEGRLGSPSAVKGLSGVWKELDNQIKVMVQNLTDQVRNIADVTTAVANGDLTKKITVEARGEILELKETINAMVTQLGSFASEVSRVAREVGTEGRLGGQARVTGASGIWKELTDNVNTMAGNLTDQVRSIAGVTTAVANGDLTRKITLEAGGEILELLNTINTMVTQLGSFASEVTRVAHEVGTEGKLGGQARVEGISGVWRDLTDNVNKMAGNLTDQVRNIVEVTTAVANGDLTQKITVEIKGEVLVLKNTINTMVDQLGFFASEVTRVAREVGGVGKLGAQANVPWAAGVWRDLTDNVNMLAANLTNQVRAIADVATAVAKGDLTRTIASEARGEVADLNDSINEMIQNLKETTRINTEQSWLKTHLARFAGMLQGQLHPLSVGKLILSELAPLMEARHGAFYLAERASDTEEGSQPDAVVLKMLSSYAYKERKHLSNIFRPGEGLVGQCALEKERILLTDVPDDYIKISSGLGEGAPKNIVVLPVLFEGELQAVIELASFSPFSDISIALLDQLSEQIGIVLNTVAANMRTESLLIESQTMAEELQNQQEELRQTNEELEQNAEELIRQKEQVERKNKEIERARAALEEKAAELALASKYKSEFLANISHELRTPLNSQMILSSQLADNAERNLTEKQVQYAQTIHASGVELLGLINEILDLAKIESGTMEIDRSEVSLESIQQWSERSFELLAREKTLDFQVRPAADLPPTLRTDEKRLQQIIKNLLANAFKFTEKGHVHLDLFKAESGWRPGHSLLEAAEAVIAFAVTDTGIGIAEEKQHVIFEAFQQADGTTDRKYDGSGLGLSISREITRLLGGDLRVASSPGKGSTFTLYLPRSPDSGADQARPPLPQPFSSFPADQAVEPAGPASAPEDPAGDDRHGIQPGDRLVLIIEDDIKFARILLETAHDKGFKALVAATGQAAVALARQFRPDAITLDLRLPDMDGLTVLDMLKRRPATRHIPVHVISVEEEDPRELKLGAISHLKKPLSREGLAAQFETIEKHLKREMKKLLVVEDNAVQRQSIIDLIGNGDVEAVGVASGKAALSCLKKQHFDCMVLDLGLPDMSGFTLIEKMQADEAIGHVPIIVFTGKALTPKEETRLKRVSESIIIKGVKSLERLLDETTLFLHRVVEKLPQRKKQMLAQLHLKDPVLKGRTVLIVDDDVRNIFALSGILEQQEMEVLYSESGAEAILIAEQRPDLDIVLMDIMMPEMDGYETTRRIRTLPQFKKLPIIALTAKAMKGDREKCIRAGASDYIAKPVDTEQLLSLLRVWLYQ
jgi:CheY-like chemotaxis protein/signal transduction histidine kinase/HAMP domain-containing protein